MHRMTCPRCCSNDSLIKLIDAIQAHYKLIHIKEKGAGITAFVQTLKEELCSLALPARSKPTYSSCVVMMAMVVVELEQLRNPASTLVLHHKAERRGRNLFLMKQLGTLRQGQSSPPTARWDDGTTWTWSPDDTNIYTEVSGKEIQKVLIKAMHKLHMWGKNVVVLF